MVKPENLSEYLDEILKDRKISDASLERRRSLFGERMPLIPKIITEESQIQKEAGIELKSESNESCQIPPLPLHEPISPRIIPVAPSFLSHPALEMSNGLKVGSHEKLPKIDGAPKSLAEIIEKAYNEAEAKVSKSHTISRTPKRSRRRGLKRSGLDSKSGEDKSLKRKRQSIWNFSGSE